MDFQVLKNSNFKFAILSKLSILFINYILRELDNPKILLFNFFVPYLVEDQDHLFFKTKTAFFKNYQIINPRPLA